MKKFLIPFMIGATVALAVEFFQKDKTTSSPEPQPTQTEAIVEQAPTDK
ncbi:MAG: hypothetical protein Q4A60_02210 [Pasteurellaceae bacterium]|nr:hypothetical protein [Pasteurellaceae bacterium]